MFEFKFPTSVRGPMSRVLKTAAPAALALAFGMAATPAAQASVYTVTSGDIPYFQVLGITGPPTYPGVYGGPMVWNGTVDGKAYFDLVAFCVDVYHEIGLHPTGLTYTDTVPLTYDSNPLGFDHDYHNPDGLTAGDLAAIGRLVNFGTLVAKDASVSVANKNVRLAAAQGAIWEIVAGVNVYGGTVGAVGGRIDQYKAGNFGADNTYGTIKTSFKLLTPPNYPSLSGAQSFAIAVPEPATWALMIGGFGMAGAMLRRERRRAIRVRA